MKKDCIIECCMLWERVQMCGETDQGQMVTALGNESQAKNDGEKQKEGLD